MDNPNVRDLFGTAVRSRRSRLGISQEELAGRAGLHRTYVSDVERGARNLSLESMDKLARALNTSIPALLSSAEVSQSHHKHPERKVPAEDDVEILLVEDNLDDEALTLDLFERAALDNRIHVVRDGAEALEFVFGEGRYTDRAERNAVRLILLDLGLPKVPGLEVLKRIKSDPRTHETRVVVLAFSMDNQELAESQRLGADAHIVKPVDLIGLLKATARLNFRLVLVGPNE